MNINGIGKGKKSKTLFILPKFFSLPTTQALWLRMGSKTTQNHSKKHNSFDNRWLLWVWSVQSLYDWSVTERINWKGAITHQFCTSRSRLLVSNIPPDLVTQAIKLVIVNNIILRAIWYTKIKDKTPAYYPLSEI